MATSGSKKITVSPDGYIYLLFSWTAGTQNVANNYTPISWKLQLISSNSSANIISSASKDYSVTVDGTKSSGTNTVGLSGGATKTLASGSKNIYHNDDGKKTFSFSFSQEFNINYAGTQIGTKSGSGTGTLDDIPRGSKLGTISNFTIGNSITIPITKYSSSFTDTLVIKIGSTTIKTISNIANGDTVTFTSSELTNIYSKFPNVTSGVFTFVLTTKSGTSTIGTSQKTATGTIPTSVVPTISSVTLSEGNASIVPSSWGIYVKSKSKLKVVTSATGGSGSTISLISVSVNGETRNGSTITTNVLKTVGSNTITIKVTDSRGRTATTTRTINVVDYNDPYVTSVSATRTDSSGTPQNNGTYCKVAMVGGLSLLSGKNTPYSYKIEYKKTTDSTWTTYNIDHTDGTIDTTKSIIISGFDINSSYNIKAVITDYFGEDYQGSKSTVLGSEFVTVDYLNGGKGVSFGKVADTQNTLDVGFEKTFLSLDTFVGGDSRSDAEKDIIFNTTNNAEYKHNCKLYGGNGSSGTSLGAYDLANNKLIWKYVTHENKFEFGNNNIDLKWGNYDIESVLAKVFSNSTGRYRTKTGLLLQWGTVSITPVANAPTSVNVTFPIAYDTTPNVQVSAVSGAPYTNVLGYSHLNDSATGTTLYITRTNTISTVLRWFAIGFKEM